MGMADRESLVRTISENPYDWGPRGVYADWCAENGLQYEERRMRRWPIVDNPYDLSARLTYADWLDANGEQEAALWIRESCKRGVRHLFSAPKEGAVLSQVKLRPDVHARMLHMLPCECHGVIVNGFIEEIDLSEDDFPIHADKLFSAHPIKKVSTGPLHFRVRNGGVELESEATRFFVYDPQRLWGSEQEAFAWLSDELVNQGRRLAGLRRLTKAERGIR